MTHFAKLKVWFGSLPESNGKANWTAILHGGDITEGFTLARSEYKDRVRYDADRVRFLLGELEKEPFILDYDGDLIVHADDVKYAQWQKATDELKS
jgi:hypothetical protein